MQSLNSRGNYRVNWIGITVGAKLGVKKKEEKDGGFEAGGSMASTSGQIGEQIEG